MLTKDVLKENLETLPLTQLVVRTGGHWRRLIGVVASPDFEGKNEAVRQREVLGHLRARLSPEELTEFEFVFTFTLKELEALDRGERPAM